jgi:branched-chain amino acid transport system permease protein
VISAWCMWAFTKSPLGRLALALRDNEHRVRFLGFNAHVARTLIFAISCLFTGVAGALLAIANEATNYTIFSAQASANVVLQTFIGGAGTFFGPALGAATMTFFARVTSDLTRSWLLYQGLIFVLIMLFAPEGLGGIVSLHARKLRAGGWRHLLLPYLLCLVVGLLLIGGLVFVVESIHVVMTDAYFAKRAAAGGAWVPYQLFGHTFEPLGPTTWAIPIILLGVGSLLLPMARRVTAAAWLLATQEKPPAGDAQSPAPVRQELTA